MVCWRSPGAPSTVPLNCHSIRKSLFSGLFGRYVHEGRVALTSTLSTSASMIASDPNPTGTTGHRGTAPDVTVWHLPLGQLSSCLRPIMFAAARPYPPGAFFMYNNWDFNALGTIFELCSQQRIFEAFEQQIAIPLQMEDFSLRDTEYVGGPDSIHPAYVFRMSARDLARYGLLYLRNGRWRDQQIIPEAWVAASTTAYSRSPDGRGYGYMWWVAVEGMLLPNITVGAGSYAAFGVGGHFSGDTTGAADDRRPSL